MKASLWKLQKDKLKLMYKKSQLIRSRNFYYFFTALCKQYASSNKSFGNFHYLSTMWVTAQNINSKECFDSHNGISHAFSGLMKFSTGVDALCDRETKSKALCRMGQLREALEEQQITTQMQWQSLNVTDNKAVVFYKPYIIQQQDILQVTVQGI